jgi:hypothetical protein
MTALVLAPVAPVAAQEKPEKTRDERPAKKRVAKEEKATEDEKRPPPSIYIPPSRGAAKTRVGAATRGPREDYPTLDVLAPDHVGWTFEPQPTLWWYLSGRADTRIDIAVIDDTSTEPLLAVTVSPPLDGGMQSLRLAEHGLHLEMGRSYQWFVALVPDPDRRSNDVIASGAIERRERGDELGRELASADASRSYAVLAKHGMWYDALDALSDRIAANPADPELRAARASLLEEVGLEAAAQSDRAAAP